MWPGIDGVAPLDTCLVFFKHPCAKKRGQSGLKKGLCIAQILRPEPPFTGVSGPSGPEIAKKSQKRSFGGSAEKSQKIPEKVKKYDFRTFGYFLTSSGIFWDFFADPPKDLF